MWSCCLKIGTKWSTGFQTGSVVKTTSKQTNVLFFLFFCTSFCVCVCAVPFHSSGPFFALHWTRAPGSSFLLDSLFHVIKLLWPEEGAAAPRTVALILSNCSHTQQVLPQSQTTSKESAVNIVSELFFLFCFTGVRPSIKSLWQSSRLYVVCPNCKGDES